MSNLEGYEFEYLMKRIQNIQYKENEKFEQITNSIKLVESVYAPFKTEIENIKRRNLNALESMKYIQVYLDLSASLKECQSKMNSRSISLNNKDLFDIVTIAIDALNFLKNNAITNPEIVNWTKLLNECLERLKQIVKVEINNSTKVNEDLLFISIDEYLTFKTISNDISTINIISDISGERIKTIMTFLIQCDKIKDIIEYFKNSRKSVFDDIFDIIIKNRSHAIEKASLSKSDKRKSHRTSLIQINFSGDQLNNPLKDEVKFISNALSDVSLKSISPLSNAYEETQHSFDFIIKMICVIILMFEQETNHIDNVIPNPYQNEILCSTYLSTLKKIASEIVDCSNTIEKKVDNFQLSDILMTLKYLMPLVEFTHENQSILLRFCRSVYFTQLKKLIISLILPIEMTVQNLIEAFVRTPQQQKNEIVTVNIYGIPETIEKIKELLEFVSKYKKNFSYIFIKQHDDKQLFNQFESSWFHYLHPITEKMYEMMIKTIALKIEKLHDTTSIIYSIDNLEYLAEMLKSSVTEDIFSVEKLEMFKREIEVSTFNRQNQFITSWLQEYENLLNLKTKFETSAQKYGYYGNKISMKKKNVIKSYFDKLNEFLETNFTKYEGLTLYNIKTRDFIIKCLKDSILQQYKEIHRYFNNVNFTTHKTDYIKTYPEDFEKWIGKLFIA